MKKVISDLLGEKTRILALSWRDIKSPGAGGAEVYTHELLKRLSKMGYTIIHISPYYNNEIPQEEEIDDVLYLRNGNIFTVINYAKNYYKKNRNNIDYVIDQCNTHRFFSTMWVEPQKRIFFIHQLTREIWNINCRFPINIIGQFMENFMLRLYKNDITITVSESTKKDLIDVGFNKNKVVIIPQMMKNQPWIEADFMEKKEIPQFVFAGRYSKYKGIDDASKAIGILKNKGVRAQLLILGKKDDDYIQKYIEPICREYGLRMMTPQKYTWKQDEKEYQEMDICFTGFVSEEDKMRTLSQAKCLLFPSNREGWGIPVSEAAFVGTPSIVYNSAGIIDAVKNGEAGYVSNTNTPDGLVEMMIRAIEYKDEYEKKCKEAYKFSKDYLNWKEEEEIKCY